MKHTHHMHESFFFSRLASTKLCYFNARMSSKRAKEHTRLSEIFRKRSKLSRRRGRGQRPSVVFSSTALIAT